MRFLLPIARLGLAVLLALLLMAPIAAQVTVHVPDDYPTIQGAIDAAADGWTILVRKGTYVENIDFLGKAVVLESTDGPEVTIIDGSEPQTRHKNVVRFMNDETPDTVLRGFTLRGGSGTGAGIYTNSASPTIESCVVRECLPGTAVHNYVGSPTLRSIVVEDNQGPGILLHFGVPEVRDCIVRNNRGDGISLIGGYRAQVVDSLFERNDGSGCYLSYAAMFLFLRCSFVGNQKGGCSAVDNAYGEFVQCRIEDNEAKYGGGGLTGIQYNRSFAIRLESCLLARNSTGERGGAVCWFGGDFPGRDDLVLEGCTIVGNAAPEAGAVWLNGFDGQSRISNSILWDNGDSPIIAREEDLVVGSSLIEGGYPGDGNFLENPLLVDPSGGDYRLSPGSICIDRGQETYHRSSLDLDVQCRVLDGDRDGLERIDLGCYEYRPEPFDARLGTVNTAGGAVHRADVLLVNGSPGDAERVATVAVGESVQLDVASPPSRPTPTRSRYVVYAWPGEPDPLAVSIQERSGTFAGWTVFPTVFSGGSPRPVRIWNTFGHERILGRPSSATDEAPTTLLFRPGGSRVPMSATVQGFIKDNAAPSALAVAVTNAVVVRVE